MAYSKLPPESFWGYWLLHVNDVRFGDGRRGVYERLFELVGLKDWFVLTSNVDALFARNGFDSDRVCSIQGDFAFLQCYTPCSTQLWPSEPMLERLLSCPLHQRLRGNVRSVAISLAPAPPWRAC